jgi:hypothetical protein
MGFGGSPFCDLHSKLRMTFSIEVLNPCRLLQTGALLLEGDTLKYFGATIPLNLAAAVIAEVVLVGGAEYYRSTNKSPLGSVCP